MVQPPTGNESQSPKKIWLEDDPFSSVQGQGVGIFWDHLNKPYPGISMYGLSTYIYYITFKTSQMQEKKHAKNLYHTLSFSSGSPNKFDPIFFLNWGHEHFPENALVVRFSPFFVGIPPTLLLGLDLVLANRFASRQSRVSIRRPRVPIETYRLKKKKHHGFCWVGWLITGEPNKNHRICPYTWF